MPKKENLNILWESSNISESFPGIILPLTFSIARRGYELAYKSQAYEIGLNWYELEKNHRITYGMVGIFAGRMYYNMNNWYQFVSLFPNNKNNQKYLDDQLNISGKTIHIESSDVEFSKKVVFWLKITKRTIFFNYEQNKYYAFIKKSLDSYKKLDTNRSIKSVLEKYIFLEQTVVPQMGRAVDNDFFVMTYNGLLKKRLNKWLGEDLESNHDFLGLLNDVISARQANLLFELSDEIIADKKAIKLLNNYKYSELDKYLQNKLKTKHILYEYREKFLHRYAEDQKLESVNPLLNIEGFYSLVKTYIKIDKSERIERQKNAKFEEKIRIYKLEKKLNLVQKISYRMLIGLLKKHLRIREKNRLIRGRVYAELRTLFEELGDIMTRESLIEKVTDIHYIEIEQLMQLADGSWLGDEFKNIVLNRKQKYKVFKNINAPSRFISDTYTNNIPKDFYSVNINNSKPSVLYGATASPGKYTGKVLVLKKPIMPKEPFDILVVSHTDPGWTPLIALSKAIIVEHGGLLSHAAIVTRELGIPSVIGVENATKILKNNDNVSLDATKGVITLL